MKDLTPLYESIHGRLAEQLSTMRHVQDDELYAMIDAEIRDAEAPLAATPFTAAPFAAAGVLISGGHDVGPTNYGAFPKPYCGMVVAMRNTPWHPVSFGDEATLKDIYGKDQVLVNSYHHQAVREPGKGVTVIATSCDGVTEAIKVEAKAFAMAVQWHPEMMFDSEEQLKVIKAFVDACR